MIHYASKQKYTRQTGKNKKFWIKIWIFKKISNLIQKKKIGFSEIKDSK